MNISANNYDTIKRLIYDEGLRIDAIDIHPELDVILIILNTKAILHQQISSYKGLNTVNKADLFRYEIIGNGTDVHWILLDEDLSLKGFLRDALRSIVNKNKDAITVA